jgi:hypothetical protein
MPITCPTCGRAIDEESIEADRAWATCDVCHGVIEVGTDPAVLEVRRESRRRVPAGFTVYRSDDELLIVRRDSGCFGCMLLVAIIVCGGGAFGMFKASDPVVNFLGRLFGCIALVLSYRMLVAIVNRTTIRATFDRLTLRHHPLPWPGAVDVAASDVHSLMVKLRHPEKDDDPARARHRLEMALTDGRSIPLCSWQTDNGEEAKFLKREIGSFFGLRGA